MLLVACGGAVGGLLREGVSTVLPSGTGWSWPVLVVNAVADGMNLVAKEAVVLSERDMVLALSESTGAHDELGRFAVTLHPFDVAQQADALHEALTMPYGLRRDRLPASLVQGLRDLFGAHTYARVDKEGTYHTLWSGDLSEVRQDTQDLGSHNPH